ncbi:SDR family oxidoreductase [Clostridium oryzae]|uniref:3-oxoacyl-[acyl-carrier-protein] reductase FabG n=1 Tax=Clostridium oryzae TaxID=1450648 RepID=A0A1V4IYP2_9CLOT|nr:SDR family oxidoreductase [Clostridium oryzae]OPJ65056.1 3-oxoacyl-[acyl-carrier-protein] reductase FabG [Clostridium oryzae]
MSTCIITGASRGIGRQIAVKLSESKNIDNFVIISRGKKALEETYEMMNKEKKIKIYAVDLENLDVAKELIEEVAKEYGTIDYLVNCAGYADPQPLLETSVENWNKTFAVNVTSMFFIIREVVKVMKKTGGKILNIASTAGSSARPGWLAYAASKAAVISISKTLSAELQEYGIKVYCISPGRCATELRKILAPDEDPTTIMQPEDVAVVVRNLLSDMGDCLDGQDITIRQQV